VHAMSVTQDIACGNLAQQIRIHLDPIEFFLRTDPMTAVETDHRRCTRTILCYSLYNLTLFNGVWYFIDIR